MSQAGEADTLYLVDASIYVFRGWFTLPDSITDAEGWPVNAALGFSDFLLQVLGRERPRHMVCAFDESLTSSWRNQLYPEYKANRESAPEELKRQFAHCRALVESIGMAGFSSPLLEADDIIATLATNARHDGFRNVVITADKDLAQVLRDDDVWWDFARDRKLAVADVITRFGVKPEQISDLLALAGDKVDNIPGVPGIGLKTAAQLLVKWRDVPTLLDNVDAVGEMKFRGAVRAQKALRDHADSLRVAAEITSMRHDDALPADMSQLRLRQPDADRLDGLFDLLGFGSLRRERWRDTLQAIAT